MWHPQENNLFPEVQGSLPAQPVMLPMTGTAALRRRRTPRVQLHPPTPGTVGRSHEAHRRFAQNLRNHLSQFMYKVTDTTGSKW